MKKKDSDALDPWFARFIIWLNRVELARAIEADQKLKPFPERRTIDNSEDFGKLFEN